MPQLIEVPGMGQVEFPDGMSDDDISSAIQINTLPATQRPKTRSLYDPEVQKQMEPAFDALETSARNGGVFGSAPVASLMDVGNLMDRVYEGSEGSESPVLKSKRAYKGYRDTFAKDFNLKPEEADDIIKHRLDLQEAQVSRDPLGQVHLKTELLAQDIPTIKKAINDSNLPPAEKERVIGETEERVGRFKEGFVNNVKQNHKEFASQLQFTGDVDKDFKSIVEGTNETTGQQVVGGVVTGVIDMLDTAGKLNPLRSEDEEQLAQALRESSSATKSINAIGYELKKGKLGLLGTDAAVFGQGAASVGGSLAMGVMTGGGGNLLFPASRVATLGPVGKTLAGAAARVVNVAPTAGFFAAQQGGQTYDQAIEAGKSEEEAKDLALKSAAIEFFGTAAFSGIGLGGVEDLASGNIRQAVKQATKTAAGKEFLAGLGKGITAEVIEESFITAADTLAVQAKLHPELTVDDLAKSLKDTALVTIASAGVAETAVRAVNTTANKTTDELELTADAIAQKAVSETKDEGRAVAAPSPSGVVGGTTESEVNENQSTSQESIDPQNSQTVDRAIPESDLSQIQGINQSPNSVNEPTPQESIAAEDPASIQQSGSSGERTVQDAVAPQSEIGGGESNTTTTQSDVSTSRDVRQEILTSLGTPRDEGFPNRVVTGKGAVVEVVEEDGVLKASVEVPVEKRRQGAATDALTKLQDLATEKQVPITLDVVPLGNNPPMNTEQLTALYEKAGAVNNGDGTLTFQPKAPETVTNEDVVSNPDTTSLKNESINKDLESFGFPPVASEFTGTDQENWEKAKARTDEGPKIVNRVLDNPASLESTADAMILLQEVARRKAEVKRSLQAVNDGDPNAQADLAFAEQAFDEAAQAANRAGSLTGALLRMRRLAVTPAYDLETMRSEVRAKVNNGAPLNSQQSEEIAKLQKQISEASEEAAVREAELTETRLALEEASQIEHIAKKAPKTNKKAEIKRRIADAKKRMAQRALDPNKSFSGADPALVKDTVALIYDYIQLGVVSLNEIRAKMVEQFGAKIGPYVDKHFAEAQKLYDELNPPVVLEPTPKNVRKMASDLVKSGVKGTAVLDSVAETLGLERDVVRDLFLETAVPTRTALSEEKARVRQLESLSRQIERLKRGVVKDPAPKAVRDAEVDRLTKERDVLVKSLKIPNDNRLIAAAQKRTAEINRRIAEKDFVKEVKVPKAKSNELVKAQIAEAKAKEEYDRLLFEAELAKRTKIEKAADTVFEAVSFMRTLKTIFDGPPIFRQGGFVTLGRPVLAMKGLAKALHAGVSEVKAKDLEANIKKAPHYQMALDVGLSLTDHTPGAKLAQQEEEFRGNWINKFAESKIVNKIPIVKQAAKSLRGVKNFSERGYVALLNDMRMSVFEIMAQSISRTGEITPEEAKVIANHINNSTGRGNLGEWEKSSKAMATLFFSAKYAASRARLILGVVPTLYGATIGPKDKRRARQAIAKDYARFFTGAAAMYALYALAKNGFDDDDEWEDVVTDPRSTDFGKLVIGKNRIDLMAGLLQWTTFMSRMATQETVTSTGKEKDLRNPKTPIDDTTYDVVSRFARGKLAPAPGALLNVLSGSNVIGQKTTLRSEAAGMVIPMSFSDIYEATRENNPMGAAAISTAVLFGTGYANYDESLSLQQEAALLLGDEEKDFKRKKR